MIQPSVIPQKRRFPRFKRVADSEERTLVSPMARRSTAGRISYWLLIIVLSTLTLLTVFPMAWMAIGGLKLSAEIMQNPPSLLPDEPRWQNYTDAWNRLNFTRYFRNTVAIALGSWLMQIFVSATAAFSLSKLKPRFSKGILYLFLITLMVPSSAYLIPQYLTVYSLPILGIKLVDTWWAIWLPGAVSAFTIYLLKSFFDEIPADLTDAAEIDGASPWQIFIQIILPLSKPVLAVTSIFAFVGAWKDFFWPLLVLPSPKLQPIAVAMYRMTPGEPLNLGIAGLAIACVPPLIVFVIFQKQIMSGITLGGVKG